MKAVILAAGYATRLYPLTKDFPKPLLKVGERTILDHLVDQLAPLDGMREISLVTNSRFLPFFVQWRDARPQAAPLSILDDGTTSNDDRLGALGDLDLALRRTEADDDVLVAAADNILRFRIADLMADFRARHRCHVCVHRVEDPRRLRRTGVAVLGEDDRVVEFAEKPENPKTSWAVPPLYIFARDAVPKIRAHLASGVPKDAPGHLIEWLCREEPVFAHRIRGSILDIGTPESLDAARKLFEDPPQT